MLEKEEKIVDFDQLAVFDTPAEKSDPLGKPQGKPKTGKKRGGPRRVKSFFAYLGTLLAALLIFLTGVVFIFARGPSQSARDIFVVSVMQTSAAKFTARMFLPAEEVERILAENTVVDTGEVSDGSLIHVGGEDEGFDINGLEIHDISGSTYKGKMMIVNDPSRVYVATIPVFNVPRGMQVQKLVEQEGALAGINGGGFEDIAGLGKGGKPLGIVVSKGVWKNGDKHSKHQVIGFDDQDRMLVGTMTGQEAIAAGVRDAVAWGPLLIVNGQPMEIAEAGGGLNPRTAIGQRADGAVLLLVIDGRQPNSLGGSFADVQEVMMAYEAVNAANLDGGTSTSMVYDGEIINKVSSLYGERPLPTCFVVKPVEASAQ